MNNRIPCTACEAMILPIIAETNNGLCGQCFKNPARAIKKKRFLERSRKWGEISPQNIEKILYQIIEEAAYKAVEKFKNEEIYGFILYMPAERKRVNIFTYTKEWEETEDPYLPFQYMDDTKYIINDEMMEDFNDYCYEYTSSLRYGLLVPSFKILKKLKTKKIFKDNVFVGIISSGEGEEESYAVNEHLVSNYVLEQHFPTSELDQRFINGMQKSYQFLNNLTNEL